MRGVLSLQRMRYFLVIAEKGSISAAARDLNLAQPALSYHVAELERLTGMQLLSRSKKGVSLTSFGQSLRQHATEIIARTELAEVELEKLSTSGKAVPRLRLGIISSLAAALTPLLVDGVAQGSEKILLSFVETGTREIVEKLAQGKIDMAVALSGDEPGGVEPIAREPMLFVEAGGSGGDITLAEVATRGLVLPGVGNPLRDFVDAKLGDNALIAKVVLEVDGPGSRFNAVANGIGSSIFGSLSIPAWTGVGLKPGVRRIVEPELDRPIHLLLRPGLDPVLQVRMTSVLQWALNELDLRRAETRSH